MFKVTHLQLARKILNEAKPILWLGVYGGDGAFPREQSMYLCNAITIVGRKLGMDKNGLLCDGEPPHNPDILVTCDELKYEIAERLSKMGGTFDDALRRLGVITYSTPCIEVQKLRHQFLDKLIYDLD